MPLGVHWPFVKETGDGNRKSILAQQANDGREGNEGEGDSRRPEVYMTRGKEGLARRRERPRRGRFEEQTWSEFHSLNDSPT
jgi:hypothetical protein